MAITFLPPLGLYLPLTAGAANPLTGMLLVNLNAAAAPTGATGTGVQLVGTDATIARYEADSFGAIAAFTARRANGTGAAPTKLLNTNQIGAFNFHGYYETASPAYSGVQASISALATQDWTSTANGTQFLIRTTPNNSTTLTTALTVDQDQSVIFAGAAVHNGAVSVVSSSFGLSGNINAPTWTTNGVRYKNVAGTLTDTTAATGTTATAYTDVWGGNTIAATNASVVFTNYYGSYFKAPSAGTNVTLTNSWGLGADSLNIGTAGVFKVSAAGVLTTTGAQLTTPTLGVATGTSLALGGATIGSNALAVTGASNFSANIQVATGTYIQWGGTTSSFAAIAKLNSVVSLGTLLADGSNFANWGAALVGGSGVGGGFAGSSVATIGFTSDTSNPVQSGATTVDTMFSRAGSANMRLGAAAVDTAPVAQTLSMQNALAGGTSNVAGADFTLKLSQGKGTGIGGGWLLQGALAGSTGTVVNPLATWLQMDGKSNFVIGPQAALATTATDGFMHVPTCAGTPTGTPTLFTGKVPLVYDTTGHILWVYEGAAWKQPKTVGTLISIAWT